MKNWKESFHPYAMITILFWSLAYVLTRISLGYFSVFALGFLRYFIASCALLVFVLIKRMGRPRTKDLKWFLASGTAGFFLYMIFFNKGCETVSASAGSIVIATVPVMTALLASCLHGEKLTWLQWAATFLEFAGVVMMTLMRSAFSADQGILLLVLAAVCLSVYNLLQRRLTKTYSALHSSAFSIFAGTLMLSVFSCAGFGEIRKAPMIMVAAVAVMGLLSSAAAYVSWSVAFAKAEKASSVSNYMFVTPFLAGLLGFLLAGEKPDLATVAGGSVILTGMAFFYFGEKFKLAVAGGRRT